MKLGEHIVLEEGRTSCAECGEDFGPVNENIKEFLVVQRLPIADAGPYYVEPSRFVSDDMEFREYYCPDCGTLMFTETARPGDEPLSEIELRPDTI